MSEQEYEISSPPPSLFFSDNDEISFDEFEQEKVPLYLKDFEEKSEKNSYETFEEQDKIIDYAENIEFTPCVIVDFVKVDREAIKENKQVKDFNQGIIQWRRCISCNKYITYFSRGEGCTIHSWKLNKQNVQVPCIGQYSCEALRDSNI
ncbi:hypothetical protein C1645_824355 [Glomus cerebriforme]|uniref:Uncharacterized protein n=1 Tax=Glomus cerebriforme TaxID=658196 RepID=A0A397SVS4_9GLOM|nr:hypothetical protein C1645_824355 [Glomus cerebriforme]